MQLDKESLDAIPYQRRKWICQCKGCQHGTHVRDYGISPFFFLDRNSKAAKKNPKEYWYNLNVQFWICGKHWKMMGRLEKSFGRRAAEDKLLEPVIPLEGKLSAPEAEMLPVVQLEEHQQVISQKE